MDYTGQLAVEYSRFSTDLQDSLDEQHEMNQETAEEIGVILVARFEDEATSRSDGSRRGLLDLLDYLSSHPRIDHLVIPQLDRLIGSVDQHVRVFEMLGRCGVRLWTYDGEVDYSDDDALTKAEQDSMASVAEVRKARKRTRKHLRSKVRNGRYTSRPAFGLRMKAQVDAEGNELAAGAVLLDDKGRVVRSGQLDPDLNVYGDKTGLEWLQLIFQWTADEVENAEIRRRLREAGVPSKNGLTTWPHGIAIRRIIRNRIYLGEQTWGALKITHPYGRKKVVVKRAEDDRDIVRRATNLGPIIDSELFVRANQVIDKRFTSRQRQPRPSTGRTKAPRTLNTLIFCGRCGFTMKCQQDRKANKEPASTWRYVCPNRADTVTTIGQSGAIRRHCIVGHSMSELRILDALAGILDSEATEWITTAASSPDSSKDKKRVIGFRQKIDAAKTAIQRIKDGQEAGIYDIPETLERTAKRQEEINSYQNEIDSIEQAAAKNVILAPKDLSLIVSQAMRLLLAGAREDHGSVERTTQIRSQLLAEVRKLVDRIELDAPTIRIYLHQPPTTAA